MPTRAPPANLVTSWAPDASAASGLLTSGAASLVHTAGAEHSLLCCTDGLCDQCKSQPACLVCTAGAKHRLRCRASASPPALAGSAETAARSKTIGCVFFSTSPACTDHAGKVHRAAAQTVVRREDAKEVETGAAVKTGRSRNPADSLGGAGGRPTHDKALASARRSKAMKRTAVPMQPAGALDAEPKRPAKRACVAAESSAAKAGGHEAGACSPRITQEVHSSHRFCSILQVVKHWA